MKKLTLLPLALALGCADPGALGEPCFDNGTCDEGLVCVGDAICAEAEDAVIQFFEAADAEVTLGEPAELFWSAVATSCTLNGQGVEVAGSAEIDLVQDETFTLACAGEAGDEATATVDVTVVAPPPDPILIDLTASTTLLTLGESVDLSWTVTGADACTLDDGAGPDAVLLDDTETFSPTATTTFTLRCTAGDDEASAVVEVNVLRPPTIDAFTVAAGPVRFLEDVLLSWSASDANACELEAEGVTAPAELAATDEPFTISTLPLGEARFTLTCTGAAPPTATETLVLSVEEVVFEGFVRRCADLPGINCTPEGELEGVNRIIGNVGIDTRGAPLDFPQLIEIEGSLFIVGSNVPLIRFENLERVGLANNNSLRISDYVFETNNAPLPDEFDWGEIRFPALGTAPAVSFTGFHPDAILLGPGSAGLLELFAMDVLDKCTRIDAPNLEHVQTLNFNVRSDLVGGFPRLRAASGSLNVNDTGMSQAQLDAELGGVALLSGATRNLNGAATPTCP